MRYGILSALRWVPFALLVTVEFTQDGDALPRRKVMIAGLGDSISAATLADTSLRQSSRKSVDRAIAETEANRAAGGEPGDLESKALYENRSTLSWNTGRNIRSHYRLLEDWYRRNQITDVQLIPHNVSIPGSKAKDFYKQAEKIVRDFQAQKFNEVALITMTLGANDICDIKHHRPEVEPKFKADLLRGFSKLAEIQQQAPIRIVLASLPRITDLGRPDIQDHRVILNLNCRTLRDRTLKFCVPLTRWSTPAELVARDAVIEAYQEALENVAQEAMQQHPNLDIHFTRAPDRIELRTGMLAVDCFHPNKRSQELLSLDIWADLPWYR